jgi:hypothetical protein
MEGNQFRVVQDQPDRFAMVVLGHGRQVDHNRAVLDAEILDGGVEHAVDAVDEGAVTVALVVQPRPRMSTMDLAAHPEGVEVGRVHDGQAIGQLA